MIFQNVEAFRQSGFSARVCVVGTGPAGMTVARTIATAGIPVVLLDAGSDDYTDDSQDFYRGTAVGDLYFDLGITRLRYLGGSSNHWAGWCRLLDERDFLPKDYVANTGWPIRRRDLEPHLNRMRDILELEPFQADVPISEDMQWIQIIKSPAVRFGQKYSKELEKSENIALVLDAYVTELAGDGGHVSEAKLWSGGGDAGTLEADYFVICTGGIENSRLLLWSNECSNGGVVPHAGALGRYWMEHPAFEGGNALLANGSQFALDKTGEAFFAPTPQAMAKLGILNFAIRLVAVPYQGAKRLVAELACTAPATAEWLSEKLNQRLRCAAQIHVQWEQAPVASNRIVLSQNERDQAGVPRAELHWKKGERDRMTFEQGLRLFGATLASENLGRLRIADWVTGGQDYPDDDELAGHHHMGGTRMSDDPATGVVDRDCRVHGMANLFVGGSSVFATSGEANPTTTLVALALRLGDHLVKVASA